MTTLEEIIFIVSKKLETLKNKKVIATSIGDLQQIYLLDEEIQDTENTLLKLKTLLG